MPLFRLTFAASMLCTCWFAESVGVAQLNRQGAARPAEVHTASIRRLPEDDAVADEVLVQEVVQPGGLTVFDIERIALGNHPALIAAQGRIHAANGNWVQVGLKPNPTVGYIADDVGADGQGGAHGIYAQQRFVRGNKLGLNREVAAAAVCREEALRRAAVLRIQTDVRAAFYRTLLAQRRLDLANQLADIAEESAAAAQRLLDAREGRRVDVLRADVDAERMLLAAQEANARHVAAWRTLASVAGEPNMARQPLQGDLDDVLPTLSYEAAAGRIIECSPQIAAARAEVDRTAWAIDRANAEPIPDLQTAMEVKGDTATDNVLVVFQAGVELPLWDRNQGGIQRAHGQHTAAVARLQQLRLQLRQQLAAEFQAYEVASARTLRFSRDILPKTRESIELVEASLAAGELSYLDLLTARRALYEVNLDYIDALEAQWISAQRIEGMLLSGSLEE